MHGYASTTIAHIVKHARVSKRTFYEHFADKEECFLALYAEATNILRAGRRARAACAGRFVGESSSRRGSTRICRRSRRIRRSRGRVCSRSRPRVRARSSCGSRGHAKFATLLREFVERTRKKHPELRPLTEAMATAVVGGIDELLLVNVEAGAKSRLTELRETAAELMRAVLGVRR